jgi:hypothetical protein
MKTRIGFVSNSSTSSFVVLGYLVDGDYKDVIRTIAKEFLSPEELIIEDEEEDDAWEYYEKLQNHNVFIESDLDIPKGEVLVGKMLSDISNEDYGAQFKEIDPQEAGEIVSKIAKAIGKTDKHPKLYTGIRNC